MESKLKSIIETKGKSLNLWKLNNTFLNKSCVKEEVSKEMKKYIELSDNSDVWDAAQAVLRWKFIAINAYTRNEERSPIRNQ